MKVSVLSENTAKTGGIVAEHGLSLYIETGSHNILFDAGQSEAFAENARRLGIDLAEADMAVLSHGHYDHGGGLAKFIELNRTAPIYANSHAFEEHYNSAGKYIGLDTELLKNRDRFVFCGDSFAVCDRISLRTCNGMARPYPQGGEAMSVRRDGKLLPDSFAHEQYLIVEDGGRRVVFSGCSQKGVLNIVEWLRPDVFVGGFHLMKTDSEAELRAVARALMRSCKMCYTCHCTGERQFELMRMEMGEQFGYLSAGRCVEGEKRGRHCFSNAARIPTARRAAKPHRNPAQRLRCGEERRRNP